MLCEGCHHPEGHCVHLWHVARDKLNPRTILELEEKRDIPSEAVELGDDQGRALLSANPQGFIELGAVLPSGRCRFDVLTNELPSTPLDVITDRRSLRFKG